MASSSAAQKQFGEDRMDVRLASEHKALIGKAAAYRASLSLALRSPRWYVRLDA